MYGTSSGGAPNIVVDSVSISQATRQSYTARLVGTNVNQYQLVTDIRNSVSITNLPEITNSKPTSEKLIDGTVVLPTMTEIDLVGVNLTPHSFNSYAKIVRLPVSDYAKDFDRNYVATQIINDLIVRYDRQTYLGTVKSGNVVNYGLFNNPYMNNNTTPVLIEDVNDFIAVMTEQGDYVLDNANCLPSEIAYVVSGRETRKFLKTTSGELYNSNSVIIGQNFQGNLIIVLPVIITDVESITAYCLPKLFVKSGVLGDSPVPSLFNQGRLDARYHDFYDFGYCSSSVMLASKGSASRQIIEYSAGAFPLSANARSAKLASEKAKNKNKTEGKTEGK